MFTADLTVYLLSFFTIWIGSGMIVSSVGKIAHKLKLPAFIISFAILGFLTSTPEIAVGINALANNTPAIFVGNLLGGVPVLFFLLIPILSIFGGGIKLKTDFGHKSIGMALVSATLPFLMVLDGKITITEGYILVSFYLITLVTLYFSSNNGKINSNVLNIKSYSFWDIVKVVAGTVIVLISSNLIVDKTIYFSELLKISPFYISIVAISLGTNLPEIMISLKSIILRKKDIAFGNYLGSAASNSFLFGAFILLSGETLTINGSFMSNGFMSNGFMWLFIIVFMGVIFLYQFAKSKNYISPKEGLFLLAFYVLFIYLELLNKI